jgi:hypothetical protein
VAFRVFISHSTKDPDIVQAVSDFVGGLGALSMVAELMISPGTWLEDKVKDMISKSDIVVALLTKDGVRSPWVISEMGIAIGMDKLVVPLLEEGVDEPPTLKGKEYIRFSLTHIEVMFESLSKFIQKRMGVKSRKLIGLITLVAGIAAVIIGIILLLYDTKEDQQIAKAEIPA